VKRKINEIITDRMGVNTAREEERKE